MTERHYEIGEIQDGADDVPADYPTDERHHARRMDEHGGRHYDRQRTAVAVAVAVAAVAVITSGIAVEAANDIVIARGATITIDTTSTADATWTRKNTKMHRHHRRGSPDNAPSEQIRFYGIPPDMTVDELQYALEQMGAVVETVSMPRHRDYDAPVGVAFAQFVSIGAAQEFMEKHGREVVIGNYTASLRYWHTPRREDWECAKQALALLNDGTRDIGTSAHHTVLIRNLDPLCDEEHVYGSVLMATDKVTTPLRVLLVRDRITRRSCSYAFVEFPDMAAATKAVSLLCDAILYPTGFQIYDRPVAVSYAHAEVFQPSEHVEYSVQRLPHHGHMSPWMLYWDQQAYLTAIIEKAPVKAADTITTT
ncbi:hypothetical protein SYNPS1DRAFT_25186 [Syncephalis pseudoplumigaleata]|uniref:RRM domain-containing protein n=1 Tax=Syncephalis pseudoplumigaleata TaxID=1712513 RepID=A0A4P9YSP4_9FUNG|nr:hypothetical protein SYNPS1DRAFT_25186 [Syncephalis pseudoplumigaleata]|eukprot:RKP22887.1 hypothetical protein SYNPS1DRAFT_25186 [Syncephalis pseudoplumigaleata]